MPGEYWHEWSDTHWVKSFLLLECITLDAKTKSAFLQVKTFKEKEKTVDPFVLIRLAGLPVVVWIRNKWNFSSSKIYPSQTFRSAW